MTTTIAMPSVVSRPQDVAILNLNMLMHLEGKYRKDLAKYLGRMPQAVSRMFTSGSEWTFNDMFKAAEFVGVTLDVLTDPTLTQTKALGIIGERRGDDNDNGDGGQLVGVDAGRRQRGSGEVEFALAA
ncbi:XRE family transcriptional regulator [uncultured Bifidobacterium sp.]|uniref:XRE family transcriptional regulator n=1 Tax=uncultured Bifidobacterium sp. TaxID=165187 RepID=UPI0025959831|nr:XRE family transcriptional regulator [uncultured Bifidobacterium sp.]